jgi:hypothetical protein
MVELLQAAERSGYDVLITVDQGIPYQMSTASRRLAVIVLHSATNQLEDLKPLVDSLLDAVAIIAPGQIVSIE